MQRLAKAFQRKGGRIGFVPTMGYLHAGHMSLVRKARRLVGPKEMVVLSIYVNPTQFGPKEDFSKYPRDLRRDTALCREANVDVIFAPTDADLYRQPLSTYVCEESLARVMEGASRPTHFRGVTTVVAKLFNIVLPDVAVFGAKDYQQAVIIRQMVHDLNFPVKLVVAPTVREPDGLAMSSRNKYLVGDLRPQATVLWKAIQSVRAAVKGAGGPVPTSQLRNTVQVLVDSTPDARLDYVEFFHPDTLESLPKAGPGAHVALAVFVGPTRLIDNARL
jgi:pantoate--beta-alanine ligase